MSISKIRFRAGSDGAVLLQVLETTQPDSYGYGERSRSAWRDATVEDLLEVAQFTRAHDYLDGIIQNLQLSIEHIERREDKANAQ